MDASSTTKGKGWSDTRSRRRENVPVGVVPGSPSDAGNFDELSKERFESSLHPGPGSRAAFVHLPLDVTIPFSWAERCSTGLLKGIQHPKNKVSSAGSLSLAL